MQQRIIAQHALQVDRGGKPLRKTFHINQWRRLIPQTFVDPGSGQPINLDKGGWVEVARDALPKAPPSLKDVKVPASLKKSAKGKTSSKKKTRKTESPPPPPAKEPKAEAKEKEEGINFE